MNNRTHLSPKAVWALCVSLIFAEHSFHENPRNTQCLNGTEIDSITTAYDHQNQFISQTFKSADG